MRAKVVGLAFCLFVTQDVAITSPPIPSAAVEASASFVSEAPRRAREGSSRGPDSGANPGARPGVSVACTPHRRPTSGTRGAHGSRVRHGHGARRAPSTHGTHGTHGTHARRHHGSRSRHAHRSPARRPARPVVTQAYIRMRARWHRPPTASERRAWMALERPPLVLRPVGFASSYPLLPEVDGTFGPEALAAAREAFRDHHDGTSIDPHPRVLELCYRAARHFRAPYVYLISGYRTTRETSRHNQGRAMDIVLPGVTEERLAAYLREQGFVGVGTYPNSGFTHVDVRNRSYYWVDRSGPDQASQTTPVRSSEIARHDAAARRRREMQVADLVAHAAESDEERPRGSSAAALDGEPDEGDVERAPGGTPGAPPTELDAETSGDGTEPQAADREAALTPDAPVRAARRPRR